MFQRVLFRAELGLSKLRNRAVRRVMGRFGWREATDQELELMVGGPHGCNVHARSFTPHTLEFGNLLEAEQNQHGDWSCIHVAWGARCKLRYYASNFLFLGRDLDALVELHRESLEEA